MKTAISARILAVALVATAVVNASPVANAAPLPGIFHLRPHTQDTRIRYTVFNHADRFYEVRIAGKVYEIQPHRILNITAPAGTQVYAAADMHTYKSGDLLHEISPADDTKILNLD